VAAIWLVLVSLSIGLAIQSRRALVETERATEARTEAEELVTFMLDDLHASLESLGRLDLLGKTTTRALQYYEARSGDSLVPRELERHAAALSKLAEVLEGQGDLTAAESAHREAVAIRSRLVELEPEVIEHRSELASVLLDVERVLSYQGRREEGRQTLARALALSQDVVGAMPESVSARRTLSACWDRVGALRLEDGDLSGCLVAFERALTIDQELFAAEPEDKYRWNLSLSYSRLGEIQLTRGDLKEALGSFETALELTEGGPDEVWWRGLSADHLASTAGVYESAGDAERAVEIYADALREHERVVAHDPTNLLSKNSEVWTRLSMGLALVAADQPRRARTALEEALVGARALSAEDPADALYREMVADALSSLADAELALGEAARAGELTDEAVTIRRGLYGLDDHSSAWTVALAAEILDRGEVERALGRDSSARAAFAEALELVEPVAVGSEHPGYREVLARALLWLGREAEARPIVASLPPSAWSSPKLRRLCAGHGITPPAGWRTELRG
jgi:tetratricopeptide (TPR) repeat protein